MTPQNSVVAVYPTHTEADQAVKELQSGGFDMHKLSIVGRGYHTDEHAVGYCNAGDRMKYIDGAHPAQCSVHSGEAAAKVAA